MGKDGSGTRCAQKTNGHKRGDARRCNHSHRRNITHAGLCRRVKKTGFRISGFVTVPLTRKRDDLGRMKRPALGAVFHLIATAETIRDHQGILTLLAHEREQVMFADLHGDVVVV